MTRNISKSCFIEACKQYLKNIDYHGRFKISIHQIAIKLHGKKPR